jgi:GAF domain-containing protein
MNELLYADELPAEELAVSVDNARLYAEYRCLADEQAAMRRVAALVARGVEPSEVFDAVTDEMRGYLHAATAGLWRYETTGEITLLSVAAYLPDGAMKWPVGTRTPIEGNNLAKEVLATGRPARMDSYDNATGTVAELVRAIGLRAGAWRPSARTGPARCRPTPRPGSAGSPNLSRVRWWPDTATSRNGRCSVRHRSARF